MVYDQTFNLPILRLELNNLTVVKMGRNTLEIHLRQLHRPKPYAHTWFKSEDLLKTRTAVMRHYDTKRVPQKLHHTVLSSVAYLGIRS
jgi:hypothetical protein